MEFKKMIIILSVAAVVIITCLFGVSYAYYSLTNASTSFETTVSGDDVAVVYAQSEYVNITTGIPITEDQVPTKAGISKFSALAGANLTGYQVAIEVALVDISLDPALQTTDFKIQLLQDNSVVKTVTGADIANNSSIILKDMSTINVGTTYNFEIRVWIQETGVSQNELMGKSFTGRVEISSSMKK